MLKLKVSFVAPQQHSEDNDDDMDNLLPFQLYLVQLQVALKREVARMLLQGCLDNTNATSEISDDQLLDPTDPVANEAGTVVWA